MRSKTRIIFGSLALAAILTSTSTSASANTVKFSYSPAELSTAVSAQHVLKRVETLAQDICHQEFSRFVPRHKMKIQRCTREVTQEIVDEISHANLDVALTLNPKLGQKRARSSNLIRVTR